MKTHTHTPGPWHYAPGELVYGPSGETVASCRFVTNFKDTNVANMRLVASAPELLAALREIESKLTALLCERVLDSTLPEFYEVRDARNSARAAIAKAEGVK